MSFKVKSSIFKNYFLSDTFEGVVGVQNLLSENYVTTLIDDSDIAENIVIVQNIIRPGMDEVRPGGLSDCYISQSLWYEPLPGHRQRELGNIWILMVSDPLVRSLSIWFSGRYQDTYWHSLCTSDCGIASHKFIDEAYGGVGTQLKVKIRHFFSSVSFLIGILCTDCNSWNNLLVN